MSSDNAAGALTNGEQYTTYVGFEELDSAAQVQNSYQVAPVWSDCKVRGEFDTLQVIDDLYIPTTRGNTTNILEPLAVSYPEYGSGGGYQMRVDSNVKFNNVTIIGD